MAGSAVRAVSLTLALAVLVALPARADYEAGSVTPEGIGFAKI